VWTCPRFRCWVALRFALEALGKKFDEVAPEAVVIIGNDQREFFNAGLTPSITVYRGATISNVQHLHEDAPGLNIAEPANSPAEGATYPGATALADHILDSLAEENFDLAQSDQTPSGAPRGGIPHAYGFFYHTILEDKTPPSVPIILNVHFPHNTPRLHRCLELGRALHRAIASFTGFSRVALMASGGLTHFVIDEEFDRGVIAAMQSGDEDALARLPETYFKVGTAEIKNWYPVIAAMNASGRRFHQVDYVPCYRSEAGTGNAMCFAYWD
jgi:OH-DDVA oxygenase